MQFSAVICCGLIEAVRAARPWTAAGPFSAVICCGLIEAEMTSDMPLRSALVFRSDMLRPH